MATYLIQASYTNEAWAAMIATPVDRSKTVAKACKALGGKLIYLGVAFGDCDVVVLVEMPDNVSAAAMLMSVAAGGSLAAVRTTPLISPAEAMEAMTKAQGSKYVPVEAGE